MSFISLTFAGFVIICLLVYYAVPQKWQWCVLLAASWFFYLCAGPDRFFPILFTSFSTYGFSLLLEKRNDSLKAYLKENRELLSKDERKAYKASVKKKQKWLLFLCLLLNLSILAFFKYADRAIAYINLFRLMHFGNTDYLPFFDLLMPLGISFYTFQSMGYLIDIYYGKYRAERHPLKFALFVSYFPQIIQGPISRFNDLMPELKKHVDFDPVRIRSGLTRIMWGLFKKLVIADRLAGYVELSIYLRNYHDGLYLLLAVFFYSLQIYGDFSGGIDVALGVSELFGIRVTENFNRPFFSKSIAEYWRRWHITLGTWFKDYVYYPLSVAKWMLRLSKWVKSHINEGLGKRLPLYIPMVIVWWLTGIWHGSESRYVVWGLLNCFFIILGTEFEPLSLKLRERLHLSEESFCFKLYRVVKTFWLMAFLRLFDISKNVPAAFETLRGCFRNWGSFTWEVVFEELKLPKEELIVVVFAMLLLLTVSLVQRKGSIRERLFQKPLPLQWAVLGLLTIIVVVFGTYGMGYDAKTFIYLNF
ncbi:MAG: MBOAT family protein [Lachnospiraceae bacterium]|nr:MBOAT family protein [Lachnospiraceae bacterium]